MIEVKLIPINQIAAPSLVRTTNGHDKESLQGLANSIKQHGLLQPIVIRPASGEEQDEQQADQGHAQPWIMVAGRRRLAACKLAGMNEVPALVGDADAAKAYELEALENIQRENLSLVDTARAVRMLMMSYDDQRTVAKILGKSPAWVSKHLAVTAGSCPAVIKDMLDREVVTDLETLLYLKSIAEIEKARDVNDAGGPTWARMLRIVNAGNMNRQIARDALASLKAPKPQPQRVTVTENPTVTEQHIDQPSLVAIDTDPKTTFVISLPINLMATFEQLGGITWLEKHLRDATDDWQRHCEG